MKNSVNDQGFAKAFGRYDSDRRTLAFEHGIRRNGRAVCEFGQLIGLQSPRRFHMFQRGDDGFARVASRRRKLEKPDPFPGLSRHHVGKGAADIDANFQPSGHFERQS